MKNLVYLFFVVAIGFVACTKEPEFPDPGLDSRLSLNDTVRRDTMDFYRLTMGVDAPNGLEKILLLDAHNYSELEDITGQFKGKTKFDFTHEFDIRPILRDTTIRYIIKVIDKNSRSYNKAISLTIYGYSFPGIKLVGEKPIIGLASPLFDLKGHISTGLNTIQSYQVLFNDVEIDRNDTISRTPISEFNYRKLTKLNLSLGQSGTLKFIITDNKGQIGTKSYTINIIPKKRPALITTLSLKNLVTGRYQMNYNKVTEKLDSINYSVFTDGKDTDGNSIRVERKHRMVFSYNSTGLLTGIIHSKFLGESGLSGGGDKIIEYTYDANNRLLTAENHASTSLNITAESWYPDGTVRSFFVGTAVTSVKNLTWYSDPQGENLPRIIGETYWTSGYLTTDNNRLIIKNLTAVEIPSYIPELPPFHVLDSGSPSIEFMILFYHKYIYEYAERGLLNPLGVPYVKCTVQTDATGRVISLRRVTMNTTGTAETTTGTICNFAYEN